MELRPQNTLFANGFLLPEREIQPTAEETFEAIKVVAQEILDKIEKLKQKREFFGFKKMLACFGSYRALQEFLQARNVTH